jgi:hypothetical protein
VRDRSPSFRPLTALATGLLLLIAGIALARLWLPEWRDDLSDKSFYVQRYRELAQKAGVSVTSGAPVVSLTDESPERSSSSESDPTAGLRIQVSGTGTLPGAATEKTWRFLTGFSPKGEPLALSWKPEGRRVDTPRTQVKAMPRERLEAFGRQLLAPGERLGERRGGQGEAKVSYALEGSRPRQHLRIGTDSNGSATLERVLGGLESKSDDDENDWSTVLLVALPRGLGCLFVAGLFLFLLSRQRIDLSTGWLLGALCLAVSVLSILLAWSQWQEVVSQLLGALLLALWIAAAWSVGESFLRSVQPGFTTSLDALRSKRLGPRGARSLLHGVALGAALAGLRLAAQALATAIQGPGTSGLSLHIPPLQVLTPFSEGILLASAIALGLALALRFLPQRWALWIAPVLGGLVLSTIGFTLRPIAVGLVADLAIACFLVWVLRKLGLTALVVTATVSFLLPAAVFSAFHLAWLPLPFAVTAGSSIALVALGWVGLRRPEQIEMEGRKAPAFIRRIEEERRLRHEMDLLARMQLGLLPAQLPEVPGWEIAVRSLLATEAGGDLYDFLDDEQGDLWIAAGDVAGHGYSCSIAQAMTAASLSSLVGASQTPSGILQRIDRVLRRNGAHRNFTTLALLRLDPRTGEGRLANAGHPFPLRVVNGEAAEVALAGLPLGQGPSREYKETALQIPPGGVLVFCSDGLFEGVDWQGVPYGYDRPREILGTLGDLSAPEILETLLADWRRHLGAQEHQDDTTVLVLKRLK